MEKVNADGEIDIDFVQEHGMTLTEMLDDGALTSRAGQQQDRFNALVAGSLGQMADVTDAQARQRALPSHVSPEPSAMEVDAPGQGDEIDEEEIADSGEPIDLVSESWLGMLSSWAPKVAAKAKPKAKQPQAKPAKPAASPVSSVTTVCKPAIANASPSKSHQQTTPEASAKGKPETSPEKKTPEAWSKAWSELSSEEWTANIEEAMTFLVTERPMPQSKSWSTRLRVHSKRGRVGKRPRRSSRTKS